MQKIVIIIVIIVIIVLAAILFLMPKDRTKGNVSNQNDTSKENLSNESNQTENTASEGDETMTSNKIKININGIDFPATLENNETTRTLLTKLPLEINMNELNGNEKYYYFKESLPSNATNIGKIENGDIMLYGSDCLVIFYESFNTYYSYTRIGKIDDPSSLKDILGSGSIKVSITK